MGLIFISFPFDLIIFYFPVMTSSNISMVKFLRIFKIVKVLFKISQISNLINKKSQQKLERANKKINAYNITFAIFTILLLSGIVLSEFENIKFLDVIYFICVTFSSVGYGDVVVSTMYGKIIAIIISVLSILGIGFLSAFFLTYINIDQEKENTDLKNEVNELKGEVNNLKKQNEKIIDLLKNKKSFYKRRWRKWMKRKSRR